MADHYRSQRRVPRMAALAALAALFVAGCGVTMTTTTPAGAAASATATASSSGTPGGVTKYATGCPEATQSVTWPSAPTVIVTSHMNNGTVSVKVGQTVEVDLPFGHAYQLMPGTSGSVLRLDAPAGYGDAAKQACVWHFTATQAGGAQLTYTVGPVCIGHEQCPQYLGTFRINVSVSG